MERDLLDHQNLVLDITHYISDSAHFIYLVKLKLKYVQGFIFSFLMLLHRDWDSSGKKKKSSSVKACFATIQF